MKINCLIFLDNLSSISPLKEYELQCSPPSSLLTETTWRLNVNILRKNDLKYEVKKNQKKI